MEVAPRPATHVYGDHPSGKSRLHIVVDTIADIGDLSGIDACLVDDPPEEVRRRLLDALASGRPHEIEVRS